ncbi:aromatic ring-hydroxylating dioxygenase subunit alpha [Paraburkholderia sp.]|uniref:aromatic ring-hydroxylating dioxygenase subunit alpha n=1 Tax=Paraburkholderia sp. TaxID=1926495 RepID=UPI002D4E1219|nr:aromatic ring-hydroxylating dioxygenase subunit alpha [Paraburkholderia sp.]HZZ05592.1 aromatic ring-hydroxylating dioxygenase subunit alpha [Paraburkholderia sp.]
MATPLIPDKSFLRHFWHPVCTLAEFEEAHASGAGPMAVRLLGDDLVVAKLGETMVAMRDRCAHRCAKLSLGRVENELLTCPYHGWAYDAAGVCRHVPACPDLPIPGKARTETFDCAVRYDIVWVRLDNTYDCTQIPAFGDWDREDMRVVVDKSYVWNTSAERRWENFTDFSHFAFVHPGTLYDAAYARPPVVPVDRIDGELCFEIEPAREMLENLPEASPLGKFNYRCTMPFTVNLEIDLYRQLGRFVIWTTSCPVDANVCRNFMIIARTDNGEADPASEDAAHVAFQKQVLNEDRPIIESQTPAAPIAEEVSVMTDKVSIQYRKWLRELAAAATAGGERFAACLRSQVIEHRRAEPVGTQRINEETRL